MLITRVRALIAGQGGDYKGAKKLIDILNQFAILFEGRVKF